MDRSVASRPCPSAQSREQVVAAPVARAGPVQDAPVANPENASTIRVRSLLKDAEEHVRRESLKDFYNANHSKAVVFAKLFLGDEDEAKDAVAHTYLKLLTGKTPQNRFFRALKQTCFDRLRRLRREGRLFSSPRTDVTPELLSLSECAWGRDGADTVAIEPISEKLDDQDPLEILVRREDQERFDRMVKTAFNDPRWRFCKRKKWAQPLLAHVPK